MAAPATSLPSNPGVCLFHWTQRGEEGKKIMHLIMQKLTYIYIYIDIETLSEDETNHYSIRKTDKVSTIYQPKYL